MCPLAKWWDWNASNTDEILGSSRGRGARAAGWFDDLIQERGGNDVLRSVVLEGGINEWANKGPEYVEYMADYDADVWKKPEDEVPQKT